MKINNTTSKLIRGDESVENQSKTLSPSDGASCSESSFVEWLKQVWNDPFLPIGDGILGIIIGAFIGVFIVKVLLQ